MIIIIITIMIMIMITTMTMTMIMMGDNNIIVETLFVFLNVQL